MLEATLLFRDPAEDDSRSLRVEVLEFGTAGAPASRLVIPIPEHLRGCVCRIEIDDRRALAAGALARR